ncbi:unnamed protein product [Linum tenue]|nr:unnamed protein product [Linum tenue]
MEQLQVPEGLEHQVPHQFQLPSKILCKVVSVCRMVEPETDEVYAQIDLLPESDQPDELTSLDTLPPEPAGCKVHSFSKIITHSDASSHGGFFIPRKYAIDCLPPLDMSQPSPSQVLVARDLHGYEWQFCHIYRGRPRRHLMNGWSVFARAKRLVAGDAFIFLKYNCGDFRVGFRRYMSQQPNRLPFVISRKSTHMGILATAAHAIANGTLFSVLYKPSRFEFIVRVNKYLEARNHHLSIGTRVAMRFEYEEVTEERFNGTIAGVGENFSPQWNCSEWRSFKLMSLPFFHFIF